jgi:hypothetical protein
VPVSASVAHPRLRCPLRPVYDANQRGESDQYDDDPTTITSATPTLRLLPWPELALHLQGEVLAFTGFPQAHCVKVWSTNALERSNKE